MNKILFYILASTLLFGGLFSCGDDKGMAALPKPVPLQMKLNALSLVMGDVLVIEISIDSGSDSDLISNEEFDIYLSAKTGLNNVENEVFDNFPEMVTFPKGQKKIDVRIPVKASGITSTYSVDLKAFVRGYKVKASSQTVIVSDYHYTVVAIKDNADREVSEGDVFTLKANIATPATEKVVIQIAAKTGEEDHYENLPSELIIPAGSMSAESQSIRIKEDGVYTGDKELTLLFSTESSIYPLYEPAMTIVKKDIDAPLGSLLEDERWVYDNPSIPFMSTRNKNAVSDWYKKELKEMNMGDPHPKISGWKFYNAVEFHQVPACLTNSTPNAHGNYVPKGFAAQNTALVQKNVAVNNERYSTVTNEGYMRMWCVKEPAQATGGASGMREYGFSAFYASKFADNNGPNVTWAPQHTRIYPGIRIEVRARVRGEKNGFNCAIWLQGNAQNKLQWPLYGEIDIFENPAGPITGRNVAYQTFHLSDKDVSDYNPNKSVALRNMGDWNIYWVEFVNENTVTMGINGQTNVTLRKSDLSEPDKYWPFDKTINPEGLHLLLTMGAPSSWALGSTIPSGWDAGFAGIGYTDSRTNNETPRMELDWIRFYTNDVYDIGDRKSGYTHNNIYLF